MATADELLAGVSTVDKTLNISNDLRTIDIPPSVKNLGVESDDEVLRLKFKMPRYIGDLDLSVFSIRINYLNAKGEGDIYTVSDNVVEDQYITFSWLVGPNATKYRGSTKFSVCLKTLKSDGTVDREYNTTIASLPVLEGLEVDASFIESYVDLLEQWRQELFGISETEQSNIKTVSEEATRAINNTTKTELEAIEKKSAEIMADLNNWEPSPDTINLKKIFIDKQCTGYGVVSFISSGGNRIEVKNTIMNYGTCSGQTLYLYGKNLFDANAHTWVKSYVSTSTGNISTSTSDHWVCTEDYIRVVPLRNQYITLNHAPGDLSTRAGMAFYKKDGTFISGTNESTVQVPGTAFTMRLTVPAKYATEESGTLTVNDIQIALDTEVTAYEPYVVDKYGVGFYSETTPCGGTHDWMAGTYTFRNADGRESSHLSLWIPKIFDRPGINTIIIEPNNNDNGITSNSIEVKYKVDLDSQVMQLANFHYNSSMEQLYAKLMELESKYGIDTLVKKMEQLSSWI